MKFLLNIIVSLTPDLSAPERADLMRAEFAQARRLMQSGQLQQIWRIPGKQGNWSVWHASDATALHAALSQLPLFAWMQIEIHPLADHPLQTTLEHAA